MASPFLSQMALGYVKQTQANQKVALDRQYAEESEKRAMELEVEKKKRLDALAFESMMQKEVVTRGLNQQGNARIAQQYEQIAATSKDPIVRKQAQKWASIYKGAGDLPTETVETLGKNLSPEKAEEKSVTDLEFERKQANEALFERKLSELSQLNPEEMEKDPKLKQRTFLALAKGLDSDYVENLREHFDAFFPKSNEEKMPQHLQNAAIQYRTLYADYRRQLNEIDLDKGVPEGLVALETQINQLATSLNDWSKENNQPQQYTMFEDVDEDPTTPGEPVSPLLKEQRETGGAAFIKEQSKLLTHVDLPTRIQQIKAQRPDMTPAAIAKQLIDEGYTP